MDPKSWPLTLGALAAVLAVVFAQGTPPATTGQAEAAPAAAAAEPPPPGPPAEPEASERWCEQVRLLEDFLALPPPQRDGGAGKAPACLRGPLATTVTSAADLGYGVDVLVALIPDPLDAGMAYRADEALAALQSGFADGGYLFDRSWLPWTGEAAKSRLYRRTPGALLFRGKDRLFLVLLVGETPKGGVHRAGFREALDLAAEVRSAAGASGPLRILGPSFSGTTESLRIALHGWIEPAETPAGRPAPDQILLVTGSATGSGLEGLFRREFAGAVRLERTIKPDDELTAKTFWFLVHRMGWDLRDVALLSESDTSYGQLFPLLQTPDESDDGGPFLVRFPSNLAQIRTAREKKRAREEKKTEQKEIVDPAHRPLELSLADEDGEPSDVIPQLSPLSATADDMAFANQLQTLCKEGVRYVGILATDLQDRLFLAEQVRGLCPDALLFTFDNHLLDAHPQLTRSMQGSLVLTSFPLYVEPKDKGGGWRSHHQSTSEFREGLVRAVGRLLEDPAARRPQEPQEQIRSWVVAVGKGDLWPIAGLDENQAPAGLTIAGTETVAFKWITASVALVLLAFWLWHSARAFQAVGERGWTAPGGGPGVRLLLLIGTGALILASGVLLVFYSLPLWTEKSVLSKRGLLWLTNLGVLAGVYFGLILACEHRLRSAFHLRRVWSRLLWVLGALLLFAVLRLAAFRLWILPEGAEFFYARAGDFGSGLSPLVSLACLLAAVYVWALLELRRRRLVLVQEISWPLSASVTASEQPLAACGRRARQLDRFLWAWLPGLGFWLALGFALAVPARRLLRGIQPIAEPAAYGWVFLTVVVLGFILGAVAFHRFFMTWRKLEETLDLLCNTWLLQALQKSAPAIDWKPLRSFGWRMPRHKMSIASIQELRVLARLDVLGPDGAALTAPDGTLDRTLGGIFEAERQKDVAGEYHLRKSLQSRFAASAHRAEAVRRELGGQEPRIADPEGKLKPGPHEVQLREIEKYLALRVAAWLRYIFAHLRYALLTAMLCGLFVLTGVSAYAFQPKRFLSFGIWAALLLASVLTLRIFVRMDRNAVLSAAAGTDAGKVSFDRTFFTNLFTYFGIPVLGVVLTQFPAVGTLLGEWFQPLLRLLVGS